MQIRIAVIDDEAIVCDRLRRAFEKQGHAVETFLSGRSFIESFPQDFFHLVFTDLRLPDTDGISILKHIKEQSAETEVILITGYGTIDSAIEAIKAGAYHYVTKPLKLEEIRLMVNRVLESIHLRNENKRLREALAKKDSVQNIVGTSQAMQNIFEMIKKVATVDCNVLLQGRSGTGKELVARAIHAFSPRKDFPFVSFNCGGFTEELISSELFGYEKGAFTGAAATKIGLLESASKGTVFLDEIGEMPLSMQVKLLHVIQEKRIFRVGGIKPISLDIRFIAATNRDLKEEVEKGEFREDLFFRLNVVSLQLPTLVERKDDIPLLISHFIDKYNKSFGKKAKGIDTGALGLLLGYDFPGNVRELENIIERAVALCERDRIRHCDLPPDIRKLQLQTLPLKHLDSLEEMEKRHIVKVLEETGYNKNLAAKILDLPRTTLWRKMKRYGLSD